MAVYKADILDIELNTGNIARSFLCHNIGKDDTKADRFGVRVYRDGEPESLSGCSIQGYMMRPNGTNLAITGSNTGVSGNEAWVDLPQAAYDYEGQFCLALKLIGGGVTGTIRIIDGMINNTFVDDALVPMQSVPTYQEILAVYDQMVAAKNGSVRFDQSQSLTETQKSVARMNIDAARDSDVSDLKSAINSYPIGNEKATGVRVGVWFRGYYSTPTVGDVSIWNDSPNFVCTKIPVTPGETYFFNGTGYTGYNRLFVFVDSNGKALNKTGSNTSGDKTGTVPESAVFLCVNNRISVQPTGYYAYIGANVDSRIAPMLKYIKTTTDIGAETEIGIYQSATNNISAPTVNQFVAVNLGNPASGTTRKAELIINQSGRAWVRYYDMSEWKEWKELINRDQLDLVTNPIGTDVKYLLQRSAFDGTMPTFDNIEKGNRKPNGGIDATGTGISTSRLFKVDRNAHITIAITDDWVYTVYEGNSPTALKRTHRLSGEPEIVTTGTYIGFIFYKTESGNPVETSVSDYTGQILLRYDGPIGEITKYTQDIAENVGVGNVIKRAYQATMIQFSPLADFPGFNTRIFEADSSYTGLPYSSVRIENLFVPQCTSIHTFMTAMRNPNSYLYKRRINWSGYLGHTYYGAVCSSFVAWCYGITNTMPTTLSFSSYEGMNKLPSEQQTYQYLKLGDMLNKSGVHIVIITDIYRNRYGDIVKVEVSEATNSGGAVAISVMRDIAYITSLISNGYNIYRYANIENVGYTPTPWVHLEDEKTGKPEYNKYCIPRRGDKANWPKGETIVLDLIDASSFSGYEYGTVDAQTPTTGAISGSTINLSGLASGKYRLRLIGSTYSEYTYFNVIETAGTAYEVQSGRKVKVTPYISDGIPSSICFCHNNPNIGSDYMATAAFHVFTAEEISAGYAIVDFPPQNSTIAPDDNWLVRCTYTTDFGMCSGQLTQVNASVTGITTETAYQRSAYIEDIT